MLYDRISPFYDWLTVSERPYRRKALQLLAAKPGETVVEIGCGTGQALAQIAQDVGSFGRALGIDLSTGMLQKANHNLAPDPISSSTLLQASGRMIPLKNVVCDAAFLSFTLELFDLEDQTRVLAEIRRVLKENGRLALLTLSTHQQTPVSSLYWSLHEAFPALVDCRPITAAPLLSAAGFNIDHQENHTLFGLPLTILLAELCS